MLILTDTQKVDLKVTPLNKLGNPAPVDGPPKWATSDESVLTVAPSEDGLSCTVTTTGKVGQAQVSVTVDADLGEGVRELAGALEIQVKPSEAVSLSIEAGGAVDR